MASSNAVIGAVPVGHRAAPLRVPTLPLQPKPPLPPDVLKPRAFKPARPGSAPAAAIRPPRPAPPRPASKPQSPRRDVATRTGDAPPDPVGELEERLRRLNYLWAVQTGRVRQQEQAPGGSLLSPRAAPAMYGKDSVQLPFSKGVATQKRRSGPVDHQPSPITKLRQEAAANPNPLERARWARAEVQLGNFMRSRRTELPPGVRRQQVVRAWPLAHALDQLPSGAMRHESFRMVALQAAYDAAVGAVVVQAGSRQAAGVY